MTTCPCSLILISLKGIDALRGMETLFDDDFLLNMVWSLKGINALRGMETLPVIPPPLLLVESPLKGINALRGMETEPPPKPAPVAWLNGAFEGD